MSKRQMKLSRSSIGVIALFAAAACSDAGGPATGGSPITAVPVTTPAAPVTPPAPVVDPAAAPVVDPAAPAPVVDPAAPAPVVDPAAPAPVVDPAAPAPVVDPAAPVVDPAAPAPVVDPAAPTPVVDPPTPVAPPAPVAPPVPVAPPAPNFNYTMVNGVGVVTSEAQSPNLETNTLDSRLGSRWSSPGAGQWIQYDLGSEVNLETVQVSFLPNNPDRQYSLEIHAGTSESNLTKIYEGTSDPGNARPNVYDVPDTQARYVRIVGNGNSDGGDNWNSYREVAFTFDGNGRLPNDPPSPPALPLINRADVEPGPDSAISAIQRAYEVEGDDPYKSNNSMVFDAMESRFTTENGNGWRNEVKHRKELREHFHDYRERFRAFVTPTALSAGTKTIIAQYHADTTKTIAVVYLADTIETGIAGDGIQDNGLFDVYVRITINTDPFEQEMIPLGYIREGETFELFIENDHGAVTMSAFGNTAKVDAADSPGSYFKFGSYVQVQDSITNEKPARDAWPEFYSSRGITDAIIAFEGIEYSRD